MRTPTEPESLAAETLDAAQTAGALLILSDFDGTLAPIVGSPDAAHLGTRAREVLSRLAERPATAVGILSGRDPDDVARRVGVPGVIYAGCHGTVVQGPDLQFTHPAAESCRDLLVETARDLGDRLGGLRGAEVERKALGVAVHYRNVAPADLSRIFPAVEGIRARYGPRLRSEQGKKVIELVPDVPWHKEECALWIREWWTQRSGQDPATAYLGDDETDEPVFQALRGRALTVRVGAAPRRSAAIRWLLGVRAVHEYLFRLATAAC